MDCRLLVPNIDDLDALIATHPNHVWSYNFVTDRTRGGRPLKLLTVVDEYTRGCLAIAVQ